MTADTIAAVEASRADSLPDTETAAGAVSDSDWMARIDEIGEELGYFQPLGKDHAAFFVDDGPILLVTFETAERIRAGHDSQMPLGFRIARRNGWSHLCVIASGATWYRDPAVWGYVDRLVDDAFFEDFERVVFYGAGMGGYAAAAFSVAAPGATVLAIAPQATLAPDLAGWDPRFMRRRRLDFSSRYGFAPDMTEGAAAVFVLYDPARLQDAMHAALFHRPHVTHLPARQLGGNPEDELERMALLEPLIEAAGRGEISAGVFYRLFRARRGHLPYLTRIASRLEQLGRPRLAARAAAFGLGVQDHPRLRRLYETAEAQIAGLRSPD